MEPTPTDSLLSLLPHYRRDRTLKPDSYAQLAIGVRQFAAWHTEEFGQPPAVESLCRAAVHDWMDDLLLEEDLAPDTVNTKRGQVIAIWNYAAELSLLAPPWRIKRVDPGNDPPTAWTLDEFHRLLSAAAAESGDWDGLPAGLCWECGLLLIYDTAARFGELWKADYSALNLDAGTWTVPAAHTKTKRGRVYTLHHSLPRLRAAAGDRGRLWPFPWGRRQVYKHWDRILERSGLPGGRRNKWHCLRRTAESHAARAKGSLWAAEAVGHSERVAKRHYLAPAIVATPSVGAALPAPPPIALGLFVG